MRDKKIDGSCCGSGRGFRKWKTSCDGVEQIMQSEILITNNIKQ